MYNLLEYSSNYSDRTGNLWFYSKNEAINFNPNIEDNNTFKSFKGYTKLVGKTFAGGDNGILKYTKTALLLMYLGIF